MMSVAVVPVSLILAARIGSNEPSPTFLQHHFAAILQHDSDIACAADPERPRHAGKVGGIARRDGETAAGGAALFGRLASCEPVGHGLSRMRGKGRLRRIDGVDLSLHGGELLIGCHGAPFDTGLFQRLGKRVFGTGQLRDQRGARSSPSSFGLRATFAVGVRRSAR